MPSHYDAVIIGGALAGSSMGLLLRRALPEARVLVVERSTSFDFKVGESTSEVGAFFLTKILGIGSWLAREQIAKNGLRFWFHADGSTDPAACSELGPRLQVRLPAFQLDRSRLDEHLLNLARAAGCEVRRPATVVDAVLGGAGRNAVTIRSDEGEETVTAGWVIDASGKAAVLARRRGTLEPLTDHPTSAMWCRFRGVRDLDDGTLAARSPEFGARTWGVRATATNHLAGYGWWAWIIPLQGGETSVGITWDRRLHEPPPGAGVPERLMAALRTHAMGAWLMEHAEPIRNDARIYTQVAYRSTEAMGDGWAAVGDAAGFMDALYSHGIDFVGNTVWAVHRIVADGLRGQDVRERAAAYAVQYRESCDRWFRSLYLDKYRYMGDAELMRAAVFMDIGCYFIGPVRLVYGDPDKEFALLPYNGRIGAWFGRFMSFYNRRLAALAEERRRRGLWGRRNAGHHCVFAESFTPSLTVRKLIFRGAWAWLRCEIGTRLAPRRPERAAAPVPSPTPAPAASNA